MHRLVQSTRIVCSVYGVCSNVSSRHEVCFNAAVAIDFKLFVRRRKLCGVGVIVIRPTGYRVAADVSIRYLCLFHCTSNLPFGNVQTQCRFCRGCFVYIVSKFRWKKSLNRSDFFDGVYNLELVKDFASTDDGNDNINLP
eukprot:Gb_40651 [translate_table: standard]